MALACGLAGLALAQGQDALVVVTGRVVAADTGAPIRNARVLGPGSGGWEDEARTDAEGRFQIRVPPRRFAVRVTKPGFVDAFAGAQTPEHELEVTMRRGAAVTIHVVDAAFVPRQARVTMTTVRSFDGSAMAVAGVPTDERGVLRVGNLGAGEYALGLGGGASARLAGPPMTDEQLLRTREDVARTAAEPNRNSVDLAQMVTLRAGEEASVFLVDLSPPSTASGPVRSAARGEVNGRILDEYGDPVQQAVVLLLELRAIDGVPTLSPRAVTTTDDRGMFRMGAVPRGTYYVFTQGEGTGPADAHLFYPGRASLTEALPIDVGEGGAVEGIDLRLSPSVAARLVGAVLDSAGRPLPRATVLLHGADARGAPVVARSRITGRAGQFEFHNVPAGRFTVEVNPVSQVRLFAQPALPRLTPQPAPSDPERAVVSVQVSAAQPTPLTIRTARSR